MKDTSTSIRYAALGQYPRGNKTMGYTLRSERYRYVKWLKLDYRKSVAKGELVATQLFDYEKDPLETVNLAANPEYKKVIDSFEAEFARRNVAQEK